MKEFIKKNFTVIVLVIAVLGLFKSCGDSRELSKLSKRVAVLEDSLMTKQDVQNVFETTVMWESLRIEEISDKENISVNALKSKK
jgi:hypothetical protein